MKALDIVQALDSYDEVVHGEQDILGIATMLSFACATFPAWSLYSKVSQFQSILPNSLQLSVCLSPANADAKNAEWSTSTAVTLHMEAFC